jgi:hypothetical protein
MLRLGLRVLAFIVVSTVLLTPIPIAAQVDLPQGPVECYDAAVRFPGARTPREALYNALLELGYNPFKTNPFIPTRLNNSPKIVAGWVATSLLRARQGEPAPTLAQWIQEGNYLSFYLTPDDWREMQSWEPDTCDGAFVHNPANADVMRLVGSLVIRGR